MPPGSLRRFVLGRAAALSLSQPATSSEPSDEYGPPYEDVFISSCSISAGNRAFRLRRTTSVWPPPANRGPPYKDGFGSERRQNRHFSAGRDRFKLRPPMSVSPPLDRARPPVYKGFWPSWRRKCPSLRDLGPHFTAVSFEAHPMPPRPSADDEGLYIEVFLEVNGLRWAGFRPGKGRRGSDEVMSVWTPEKYCPGEGGGV